MLLIFTEEMTPEIRKQVLSDHATSIETTTYLKPLTPEELDLHREKLAENSIKLSELENQKKETAALFKEQMDPLKDENKMILGEIKSKQTKVNGTLYHVCNFTEKMMESYDEEGNLIASRRLRPDERQGNVFNMSKII